MQYKRTLFFLIIFIFSSISGGYAWAPIIPDIRNRGYFHFRKGEEFFEEGNYRKTIEELNKAYEYSFDKKEKYVILKKCHPL